MPDSKPSVTAAVVASTLLLLPGDPELGPLLDPLAQPAIDASVRRTIPIFGELLDRVPRAVIRRVGFAVERLLSPGFITHYALRKHTITMQLRRAVDDGFRQVVMLGAGFDMLSTCLPTDVAVLEVDLPATQEAKHESLGAVSAPNVSFVPLDLRTRDLRDALLAAPRFDRGLRTLFVAEGLLMYLDAERVRSILRDVASFDGARAVLSVITPDRRGRYRLHSQRRFVDACMRYLEEPFVWGASREDLSSLLASEGLVLESATCTTEVRDRLLGKAGRRRMPRASGELVVVATACGPSSPRE